ncbi:MAG TPA: Cro/CI family transcriptional regulator [Burkholderiales bacterium]|nr:Cro/CI family transcriptional regulator [Burkholderiales bacterium]
MLKETAVTHFGSQAKLARALRISTAAVALWKDSIPELSARRLHDLTNGALEFDPSIYERRNRRKHRA